ncbi:MAG TPA: lipid A deacylase LpxR family protein [Roseomonas sp.]|jgi:hypothetical protein
MTLRLSLAAIAVALMPVMAQAQSVPVVAPPPPPPPPPDLRATLSLSIENDILGGTDRYYTNGLQLSWYSASADLPQPLAWLNRQLDPVLGPGQLRWGAALGQSIYTPQDTQRRDPDPRDRPYAGFLYGTVSLARDAGDSFTVFELQAGLVGPGALGEQVQNNFHDLIGDSTSRGWNYQLKDEFVFGAVLDRTWRVPLTQFLGVQTELLPSATLSAGTITTYAAAGAMLRIGQGLEADYGPPRIRPSLSGSAFFQPRTRDFGWYLFGGVEGRAVARDIFLDGNTWRDSRSVSHRPFVGDMQIGAAVMWNGVRISYTQVWRSEEFYGQRGGVQQFGSVNVTFRF